MRAREMAVGDWVRFYHGGRLVIGVVQYLEPAPLLKHLQEIMTDAGSVNARYILEVRATPPPQPMTDTGESTKGGA